MKTKRAYLFSQEFGTVQIGDTVFQLCTGAKFQAERRKDD